MSDALPRTLPEVLIWPRRAGEYVVANPFVRSYALGDDAFVALIAALREGAAPPPEPVRAVDARRSPFEGGLLGDPTGLDRQATLDGAEPLDADAAIALARKLMLVTDDEAAYQAHLAPRENVLDRARRGNVHQRVGEYVLLDLRERSVDRWWTAQKFTDDLREPRPGPYRDVQWRFMESYYTPERLEGARVLDFGCGPGLFSRLFARSGATVVGVDPSEEHIDNAARLAYEDGVGDRATFRRLELPVEAGLAHLADERYDLIFLSDVLMFYFHSYDPSQELDPEFLLRELRNLLAPGGRITVLEPNGTFWQQPWLGTPERPFTILTEYRHRRYGVTPTLEELSRATERAGLAIARVRELVPPPDSERRLDTGYAMEFPLWWFFELVAVPE